MRECIMGNLSRPLKNQSERAKYLCYIMFLSLSGGAWWWAGGGVFGIGPGLRENWNEIVCLGSTSYISTIQQNVNTVEPRFNDLRYNDIPGMTINIRLPCKSYSNTYGEEPRYNDLRYDDIPGITINIRLPCKSYSNTYGAEPRYNDLRYDDIPGLTMGISLTERETSPVITIKTISKTAGNAIIVNIV